mmetsp:Transcript_6011/g.16006  ORF Transcript_6011/g.16006 Transcript_6011/m.16006 type:complete len:363 (-) Transcript_6011:1870-2958(-)
MTVSAPVRLMPTPPERVDRMKQKILGSVLKRCIRIWRCSGLVEPSRRMYVWACRFRNDSSTSSILAIWVKMRHLWPVLLRRRSRLSNSCSLPQSNCSRRRSGKNRVRRMTAVCSGALRANHSSRRRSSSSADLRTRDTSGWDTQAMGRVVRAFGIANMNSRITSLHASARPSYVADTSRTSEGRCSSTCGPFRPLGLLYPDASCVLANPLPSGCCCCCCCLWGALLLGAIGCAAVAAVGTTGAPAVAEPVVPAAAASAVLPGVVLSGGGAGGRASRGRPSHTACEAAEGPSQGLSKTWIRSGLRARLEGCAMPSNNVTRSLPYRGQPALQRAAFSAAVFLRRELRQAVKRACCTARAEASTR